jgi:hypothetical protein
VRCVSIVGVRYSCSVCPTFDHCEECERAQRLDQLPPSRARGAKHSAVHPLVQLLRPESLGFYRHVAFSRARARLAHTLPDSQPMSSPGWNRELFLADEATLDALTCAICLDVVKDPKLTECGHMFCSFCLMKSAVSRLECPMDRLPLRDDFMHGSSARELALRDQINALLVTGSGKTLAYILPLVQSLSTRVLTRLRALILLPSRDLALQVLRVLQPFATVLGLKVECVLGQSSFAAEQA